MNCNSKEGDDCGLQQSNDHVWVHNCDFFYGDAGSDADQIKGDGALDTKKSTYVTHSYNHFWDNGKCNLQGMKEETAQNYITYHHNGATSSFLSDLYVYPKLNLGFLIVVNTNDLLCVQPSIQFVTTLINFLIYNVYDTYDGVDSSLFFFMHFTYDCICLSIILIPTVYLGITIARKIKRKKYTWFIDIKGKILFGVDVLVLLILPIIILIICFTDETREFICTNVKDFLFTIITVCVALWLNFIIKIVYIILYKKFNWEDGDKKGKIDNIEMINSGEDADNDNKDYNIMES
jgi:hypothetical protein